MDETPRTTIGPISPFFIVRDVRVAAAHYVERLGFELQLLLPPDDPFFAIVGRDGARILLKAVAEEVQAQPNPSRHEWAPWDAFVHVEDPDALAAELEGRGAALHRGLHVREDGLRGIEVRDPDGYVLFLGRPE